MKRTIIILLFCVMPSLAYGIEQVEFTMTLSQKGSGPGQVREPSDIAVDSDGTIFVAEKGNKRIHVMGKDGRTINTWSSRSGRRWKLESPEGIALYKNRVYVTDSYYDQVLIFHKDGKFIDVFGGPGKGPKQFDDPQGICAHRGVVYVADNGNHRVQTFSLDGVYLGSIGKKGKDKGEMREPTDVAVDHRGFIYVSEEGNRRVGIFRPSRKHHRYFYDFLRPISVAVDGEGFFVADAGNYKIKKYNLKEDLILSFGRKGDGRAQFRAIAGLAVDEEGKIFVADSKKSNIQVFSPEKVITMPSESAPSPYSVKWMGRIKANVADVVWHKDRLYATSRDEDALLVIYKNAVRKVIKGRGFDDPYGIAVDAQGFLWIVDSDNDRLVKMDSKGNVISTIGRSGSKEGYFSSPKGIVISDKGFIYVADSGNERVQIFNTKGIYINKIEKISKKKLDEPVDVALDRLGNVYIVDEGAHQVVKYDSSGRFLLVIGGEGERAGKFQDPNSVLILNDEVFVLDSGNIFRVGYIIY